MVRIAENRYSVDWNNFRILRQLEADKTYYYAAAYDGAETTGAYTVSLDRAGGTISGHVQNASGEPLSNIGVYAYYLDGSDQWRQESGVSAGTDPDGDYTLAGIDTRKTYMIWFYPWTWGEYLQGYYAGEGEPLAGSLDGAEGVSFGEGDDVTDIDATLRRAATMKMSFVDAEGEDITYDAWATPYYLADGDEEEDASWEIFQQYSGGTSSDGETATYALTGLDPERQYRLYIGNSSGYMTGYYAASGLAQSIGDATTLEFEEGAYELSLGSIALTPSPFVEGVLTDVDSNPVAGTVVRIWTSSGGEEWTCDYDIYTYSKDDGSYAIYGLEEGVDYRIEFCDSDDYLGGFYSEEGLADDVSEATSVSADTSGGTSYDATLPAAAKISGRVTDGEDDGVAGAWVTTYSSGHYRGVYADEDGSYTIGGLRPGTYILSYGGDVRHFGGYVTEDGDISEDEEEAYEIVIEEDGQQVTDIDILAERGASISGSVTDVSGETISNAVVYAYQGGSAYLNTWSDGNGEYAIGPFRTETEYKLNFDKDGYIGGYWFDGGLAAASSNADAISFGAIEDRGNVDVTLYDTMTDPAVTWPTLDEIAYGRTVAEAIASSGSAAGRNGSPLEGVFTINSGYTSQKLSASDEPHSIEASFAPRDASYNTATTTLSLTVTKAMPQITWPTINSIIYGSTFNSAISGGSARDALTGGTLRGAFAFDGGAETPGAAATPYAKTLTWTPAGADATNYSAATTDAAVTVNKATPTYTLPTLSPVTYSPTLTLGGIALPDGWAWDDANEKPTVSKSAYAATFTPEDASNYLTVQRGISLTVNKADPTAYPQDSGYAQIPALAPVTYSPTQTLAGIALPSRWSWVSSGATPVVNNSGYAATFTSADPNYSSVTETVPLTVSKATPTYTLPTLSPVTYSPTLTLGGIALPSGWSWTDGNETPYVAKTAYAADYTPEDTDNYTTASALVPLTVNKATPAYAVPELESVTYSPTLTLGGIALPSGWAWDDDGLTPTVSGAAYAASFTPTDTANYLVLSGIAIPLAVSKATPVVTWPAATPADYRVGLTLGDVTLAGGSADIAGSFSWKVPGTWLSAPGGSYTAVFTPTGADKANYETLEQEIAVVVNAVPLPATIGGVTAFGDVNGIVVNWSISTEVKTDSYRIYRKAADEDAYALVKTVSSRGTVSWRDTSPVADVEYSYYVTGVDRDSGLEGEPSYPIAVATRPSDGSKPRITQFLPANGTPVKGAVALTASAEDDTAVARVEFGYITDGGVWTTIASVEEAPYMAELDTTGLEADTVTARAVAYDESDNASDPVYRVYPVDNQGPEQVAGLTCSALSTVVTLSWSDVADDDLAYFRVERKDGDGYVKAADIYGTLGANITGLSPGAVYVFRVVAYDLLGNSGIPSADIIAQTPDDITAPVVSSISPESGRYSDSVRVAVTADDDFGIGAITIQTSLSGASWTDVHTEEFEAAEKTKTYSYTLDLTPYSEGVIYVRAVATDASGNAGDSSNAAPYVQHVIDRTPPAAVYDVTAESDGGVVRVAWQAQQEANLKGYSVYRAEAGSDDFDLLEKGRSALWYDDCAAQAGCSYRYMVTAVDLAGNESEPAYSSEAADDGVEVNADTTPPEVTYVSLQSGSVIGPANRNLLIYAMDNRALTGMAIEYRKHDEPELGYTPLAVISLTNGYNAEAQVSVPIEDCADGEVVDVRFVVEDAAGNESAALVCTYTVDKTAPDVRNVTAEYSDAIEKVMLAWDGNQESDLAGYRVMRRTEGGAYAAIATIPKVEGQEHYTYSDASIALGKSVYGYRIEAVDAVGNKAFLDTPSVATPDRDSPTASVDCDSVMEKGKEYEIDASGSSDNGRIVSYEFDFGDGTTSGARKPIHVYGATGDYTITLRVTDDDGNQSVVTRNVTVKEPAAVGSLRIAVKDQDGAPVPGATVYFDMGGASEAKKKADGSGCADFTAEPGQYAVGAFIADNEWLPVKKFVTAEAGVVKTVTLTMVYEPMVEGSFEHRRMTLEEIEAAGIDVSDPANQYIVEFTVYLDYQTRPVTLRYNPATEETTGSGITSGDEKLLIWIGGLWIDFPWEYEPPDSCEVTDGGIDIPSFALLNIPVRATALKDFFDVRLTVINNADSGFLMTDNEMTLDLPEGLTLMDTGVGSGRKVTIPEIPGQSQHTTRWIVRGDETGLYKLQADYAGTLEWFNERVAAHFETDEDYPLEVFGLTDVEARVDVSNELYGGVTDYNLSLINNSDRDIYMPFIETIEKSLADAYSTGKCEETEGTAEWFSSSAALIYDEKDTGTPQLDQGLSESLPDDLTVLKPGERVVRHFTLTDKSGAGGDPRYVSDLRKWEVEVEEIYGLTISVEERTPEFFGKPLHVPILLPSDIVPQIRADAPWGRILFEQPASVYSSDLALASSILATSAYNGGEPRGTYVANALDNLGFDGLRLFNYEGNGFNVDREVNNLWDWVDDFWKDFYENTGYAFGVQEMTARDGEEFNLIAVTVQGTDDAGDIVRGIESGYEDLAAVIKIDLLNYLTDNNLWGGNNKYLIVGHDLGGGVAGVLASRIIKTEWAAQDDVYSYTIGAPNVALYSTIANDGNYASTFNIRNPYDPIAVAPPFMHKYGQTSRLPDYGFGNAYDEKARAALAGMLGCSEYEAGEYFENSVVEMLNADDFVDLLSEAFDLIGVDPTSYLDSGYLIGLYDAYRDDENISYEEYQEVANGVSMSIFTSELKSEIKRFAGKTGGSGAGTLASMALNIVDSLLNTHKTDVYIASLQTYPSPAFETGVPIEIKYVSVIDCPVDIDVYDESDNLVGRITNDVVDSSIDSDIELWVEGEAKFVKTPELGTYRFKLTGAGAGTMKYSVFMMDDTHGFTISETSYEDVVLAAGKTMTTEVGSDVAVEDVKLYVTKGEEKVFEVGASGSETLVDTHVHTWGAWTTVKQPTEAAEGSERHVCTVCGTAESRAVPKLPPHVHTWGAWRVVTPATAEKAGLEERVCTVCGDKETRAIAKLPAGSGDGSNATGDGKQQGAGGGTSETPVPVADIPAAEAPVAPGQGSALPGSVTFPDGTSADVKWTSADGSVAKVDSKGNLVAVGEGQVKLTATDAKGRKYTITVTVAKPVTAVGTPLKTIYLKKGASLAVPVCAYSVNPATKKTDTTAKLTWTSSKPKVAAVDARTGKIKAKAPGTAKVTAKAMNGRTLTITVKVVKKAVALKKFAVSGVKSTLKKGKSAQLKIRLTPSKATNLKVKFKSSKKSVLSVDKAGRLTAVKKGKAKITITVGKKKVTKSVTVK
jgi:uncharacterized protein YjdB/fibronectin type 3 domain-containing protein/protocatechuate 3,4-dioxygenase beta subunit